MPEMDGFDLLERIPNKNFNVIFVSAFSVHALRAWKMDALYFVVKPIVVKDLIDAVTKAERQGTLSSVQMDFIRGHTNPTKIGVYDNARNYYIDFDEIIYIEAADNYCKIIRKDGTRHLVGRTLGNIEDVFEETHFMRVHRSYIVNLNCVKEFKIAERSITMLDGTEVPVSREKVNEFNGKWRML